MKQRTLMQKLFLMHWTVKYFGSVPVEMKQTAFPGRTGENYLLPNGEKVNLLAIRIQTTKDAQKWIKIHTGENHNVLWFMDMFVRFLAPWATVWIWSNLQKFHAKPGWESAMIFVCQHFINQWLTVYFGSYPKDEKLIIIKHMYFPTLASRGPRNCHWNWLFKCQMLLGSISYNEMLSAKCRFLFILNITVGVTCVHQCILTRSDRFQSRSFFTGNFF